HKGLTSCTEDVDAINITGYFAGCLPQSPDAILDWLGDGQMQALNRAFQQLEHGSLLDNCEDDAATDLDATIAAYSDFGDLAKQRGLGLYVYESGTHFAYDGDDDDVKQFFVDVSHDERMHDLYMRNFAGFKAAGGEVMNVWGWIAPDDSWA